MAKTFNKQIFSTTYKDDHTDSDGYHRILFNSGRALQARELTQLQTIIQKEITRMGNNIFRDGAPVNNAGSAFERNLEFIKIKSTTPLPTTVDIVGNVFVGQTSGIKIRVEDTLAATADDPETIYVTYMEQPTALAGDTAAKVTVGETLQGTIDGNVYSFDVQSTNTAANPAYGRGLAYATGEGSFFAVGRFVFSPKQRIYLSKYTQDFTGQIVFKVTEDIITSSDNDALFDNQGATPNRSSPGADRYRIRLTLMKYDDLEESDNWVPFADIVDSKEVSKVEASEGFNMVREHVATRVREIHGNFIKKYFKARFEPNNATEFKLIVDPGLAYIDGYRVQKNKATPIVVERAQATIEIDNQGILTDYANYFLVSDTLGAKGMLNFDDCQEVNLYDATGATGNVIGTTNVRALTEFQNSQYRLHVFNTAITDNTKSLRNVRSVGTGTSNYYNIDFSDNTTLREVKKKALLFDSPIPRPKNFTSISMSVARRFAGTTDGSGNITISLTASGENFENTSDWVVASATDGFLSVGTPTLTGGGTSATIATGAASTAVEILAYVKKGQAKIRSKTLTETTVSGRLDSDGDGVKYLSLGKSDIFSLNRVRVNDSDGTNIFTNFKLDTGHRDTHYDDGKLIWKGTGPITTDSAGGNGTTLFARYKYFAHGTGDFFAVNSYTGQVDYVDIPAHRMNNGRLVSLRDVLDFRPATNGSGSFTIVNELPQPTDTVEMDAEFYLPRKDKLALSKYGELRYLQGTPSLSPKFPETPTDCIDLYKFEMNPFTLHTKDLKSRILPLKGYTMADINKIETKLDKVEEMAVLSMLELKTQALKALDSSGADRTKSGFFVDNFANHVFSDTKNPEHRATIDPQKKLMRPPKKETVIDLRFDSANSNQLNVKKTGDIITLDYTETEWYKQDVASRTENLNPFFIEKVVGSLTMSPASDYWKEIDIMPPQIIDQPTVLDTSNAVNWNNHEWDWGGVPLDELQVGATQGQVTGTSTTRTSNTLEPRQTGQSTTQSVGDWTVTGTTSNTTSLGTQTDIVSQSTEEQVTDWGVLGTAQNALNEPMLGDGFRDQRGGGRADRSVTVQTGQIDTIQTTTSETRETLETVDTTTLAQTTTTTTETEFTTETQTTTTTSTTTTVNRIAGEHTVREVVGQRVFDLISIPWMRSRKVSFRGDGLRPNTRYFPFFDDVDVSAFCIATTNFVRHSDRNPETRTTSLAPAVKHSEQTSSNDLLVTDTNGQLNGEFEIPNNSAMRFLTGTREFAVYDVSVPDTDAALSFAKTQFTSTGHIEPVQDIVHSTRVLEVVGSATTDIRSNTESTFTTSTNVAIEESTAVDVQTETTQTEVVVGTETTEEVIDTDPINTTIFLPRDPLAQTFFVDVADPNGAFLTKVRVYFATKDDEGLPVEMQIRPVINGVPAAAEIVPGARKILNASAVTAVTDTYADPTIDEMLANGTDFEFDEPIYLAPLTEYAIVLITPSMKYRTYISRVEDFVLGSTERRISEQPSLASLFKSQNSFLWEPSQTEDLAYQLFRADFQSQGNVFLENVNVDPAVLTKNPFVIRQSNLDAGSGSTNKVTVIHRGHGLRQGDITTIAGLDSATEYEGVLGSSILGNRIITSVDGTGYEFEADSAFTSVARFGGGKCSGSVQPTFDLVWPSIQTMKVPTTNITMSAKFTSNSSLVDSASGRFVQDSKFELIQNQTNNYFNAPRCIINPNEEATELTTYSHPKSAIIQLNLTTTDSKVSPIIDMQRAGLTMIGNMIDKQDSASTDGYNVPLSYVAETAPNMGSHLAKHVTTPVTLEEAATGLKVILAANKPPEADFLLYYKTGEAEDNIVEKNWVLANADGVLPSDTNQNIFREYRYTIGGFGDLNNLNGGDMGDFRQFQLKIVMRSTNSAKVPVIRDLRAIALAV